MNILHANRDKISPTQLREDAVQDRLQPVFNFVGSIKMTLLIAVVTLTLTLASGQLLQFDLRTNRWWTVLTSHLVHHNLEHLFWDLLVFVGIGAALERRSPILFGATFIVSAVAIPPLALLSQPLALTYRGLSGIDTALFAAFAMHSLIRAWLDRKYLVSSIFGGLLLSMIGKCQFEIVTGNTLFVSSTQFVTLVAAHLVGATVGCGLACLFWRSCNRQAGFDDLAT